MNLSTNFRTGRHCVFEMHVHLVFVSKFRRKIFTKTILDDLKQIFEKVCLDFECEMEEMDGEDDHVHLLVNFPPKVCVSKLVNSLKGVSSRLIRKKYGKKIEGAYLKNALWSPSYFAASCGGAPLDIIKKYIENQNTPK